LLSSFSRAFITVTPDDDAQDEGIYVQSIDSFVVISGNGTKNRVRLRVRELCRFNSEAAAVVFARGTAICRTMLRQAKFEFEFRVVAATETSSAASSISVILMTG
jgi:hypothetical protein